MKLTERQREVIRHQLARAREIGDRVAIIVLERRLWADLRA